MDISFMVELDRIFGVDISFEAERSLGEDVAMLENCLENFLFSSLGEVLTRALESTTEIGLGGNTGISLDLAMALEIAPIHCFLACSSGAIRVTDLELFSESRPSPFVSRKEFLEGFPLVNVLWKLPGLWLLSWLAAGSWRS